MSEKIEDFSVLAFTRSLLARWWVITFFMVIGGIVGLVVHYLQPPVYEAETRLIVSINTREYHLTPTEEDRVLTAVEALMNSLKIQRSVVRKARSLGYSLSLKEFWQKAALERGGWILKMRIQDRNPAAAAELVNLWAAIAYQELTEAQTHALKAYQIQTQLDGWLVCLPGYVTPTPVNSPQAQTTLVPTWNEKCEKYTPEEIKSLRATLSDELAFEKRQSRGVSPFLEFALSEKASAPVQPILYGRGTSVFAGIVIGLIVAIWTIRFWGAQRDA